MIKVRCLPKILMIVSVIIIFTLKIFGWKTFHFQNCNNNIIWEWECCFNLYYNKSTI